MPTWDDVIKGQRERIAAKLAERKTHEESISDVQARCLSDGGRAPSDDEATLVREARAAKNTIDAELDKMRDELAANETERAADVSADALTRQITPTADAPKYDQVGRIQAEPRTYTERASYANERSFFQDLYQAEMRGDFAARDRLTRHSNEVLIEREMSERALATGGLAGLVPPQYLVDKYALLARAGRPAANVMPTEPIPSVGMSFLIPRGTTGASAAVQASENSALSTTDEVWSNVTVNVASVGGYAPVSRQSLERGTPGVDQIIFRDLVGAYGVAVDQQVLTGTGASGQTLGILQTASINQSTAFVAAATTATFYTKLAGQLNAVETTRYRAPNLIIMHPRRWNWLLTQVDTAGRPLVVPNQNGAFNALGLYDSNSADPPMAIPVGSILGLPVITDASIPTAVGSGPEDQVIVMYKDDSILYEDSSSPTTVAFEQTAATTLTVTLVAYGYVAFTAGRYPSAVGVVGGNSAAGFGLIAPTF